MINFIVLDFGEYKVDLYDEGEFIEHFDADPMDPADYDRAEDRIIELVEINGYDIAWSREDAVSKVLEEIELLAIEDGDDDDEKLIGMAKMLIQIAEGRGWDRIIERNTPYDYGETVDFDL